MISGPPNMITKAISGGNNSAAARTAASQPAPNDSGQAHSPGEVRVFSNQWSWKGPGALVAGGISMNPQDA